MFEHETEGLDQWPKFKIFFNFNAFWVIVEFQPQTSGSFRGNMQNLRVYKYGVLQNFANFT